MYIGNRTDLPLSPEGVRELQQLRQSLEYPDIERLYTSPLFVVNKAQILFTPVLNPLLLMNLPNMTLVSLKAKPLNNLNLCRSMLNGPAADLKPPKAERAPQTL